MIRAVDIVGLTKSSNGRSCERHGVCGEYVMVGDVLILHKCVVVIDGVSEAAVSASKIIDGASSCRVGFIRRNLINFAQDGMIIKVETLYEYSESAHDRRRSHMNGGMTLCVILN